MHLSSLRPFTDGIRDLVDEVRQRAALRRDAVVSGSEVRCLAIAGEPVLRVRDQILPLTPPAAEALAALVPISSGRALIAQATSVDAWFAACAQVRLLIEERRIIAVLPAAAPPLDGLAVLDCAVEQLHAAGHQLLIDRSQVRHGEWSVSLVAQDVVNSAVEGDLLYAGVHLGHAPARDTEACSRIFRLVCRNGTLMDTAEGRRVVFAGQLPPDWQERLGRVINAGFAGSGLDDDTARLRRHVAEIISSPYEHLCHLVAQGLITAEEQVLIQRAFARGQDQTLYGLINAITSIAHRHRDDDDWRRALAIERLGGEIARGDHMPPSWQPDFVSR